jgi:hypothetical protein
VTDGSKRSATVRARSIDGFDIPDKAAFSLIELLKKPAEAKKKKRGGGGEGRGGGGGGGGIVLL